MIEVLTKEKEEMNSFMNGTKTDECTVKTVFQVWEGRSTFIGSEKSYENRETSSEYWE